MQRRVLVHLLALAAVLLFGLNRAPIYGADPPSDPDERFLKDAGIATDDASLLALVRAACGDEKALREVKDLIQQLGDRQPAKRREASEALSKKGVYALRPLEAALKDPDQEVRKRAEECITAIRRGERKKQVLAAVRVLQQRKAEGLADLLGKLLEVPDDDIQAGGTDACKALGPKAAAVAPALVRSLKPLVEATEAARKANDGPRLIATQITEEAAWKSVGEASRAMGPKALVGVIGCLDDENPRIREITVRIIGDRPDECDVVLPSLKRALNDKDQSVRIYAINGITGMKPAAEEAAKALATLLEDPDGEMRVRAAVALHVIGRKAKPAVPALLIALKGKDLRIRYMVAMALGQIGDADERVVPALTEA